MLFYKTFRYRVYPGVEQVERLARWSDALRFLWNLAHEQRLYGLRASVKKYYTAFDQSNELTALRAELPWLADVPRNVCERLLAELDQAWQRCFKRLTRRPNWKKHRDAINFCEQHPVAWWLENGLLHFPKLGVMPAIVHRPMEGRGKVATLVQDVDQWFVCITCEVDRDAPAVRTQPVVALDRGITVLVADSDGSCHENPRRYQSALKRLAHAQRVLNRRKRGSNNQEEARLVVAKIHRTIRRQRDHTLHTISSAYSKSHAVVVLEDLRIENMIRNHRLALRIRDAAWGRLGELLEYKLAWNGGTTVKVPAHYSSQTCAVCGHVDAASRNGIEFQCTSCGHRDHADNNAAAVLKQRYLKQRADESSVTGCGGSGAKGPPKKQQLRVARRRDRNPSTGAG